MTLSLDWEESLFRGLRGLWRRLRPEPAPLYDREVAALLTDETPRLVGYAQLIAGRPLALRPSEGVGGVRGAVLLLPQYIAHGASYQENLAFLNLRVAISATCARLMGPALIGDPLKARIEALFLAQRAVSILRQEWPTFDDAYQPALELELANRPDPSHYAPREQAIESLQQALLLNQNQLGLGQWLEGLAKLRGGGIEAPAPLLWGGYPAPSDVQSAEAANAELARRAKTEQRDGTELQAPPRDQVKLADFDPSKTPPPVPIHTFEKVETLDNYKGGSRQSDGSDELADHEEALSELDLREVVRGGEPTQGLYRAELDLGGAIPDVAELESGTPALHYPEWFFGEKRYRPDWTSVYLEKLDERDPAWAIEASRRLHQRIESLYHRLLRHRTRNLFLDRQVQGEEVDLDALIEGFANRRAGLDPGERFYQSRRRPQRDIATTVLLDISLSSGGWVENRRVLDVTRETLLVLGEVAHRLGDPLRVLGFASHTRHNCRLFSIKDWRESWPVARARLGAITPRGYTRFGPAIRHALAELRLVSASHKCLFLITDGKPTDYDRYEGRYGIEDVRMATLEGARDGIRVHAIGLDPSARAQLPAMFGVGGWQLVRHLADLPDALVAAYGLHTS